MKKEKYLEAIYDLIIEHGFDSMRMEEIAEKIGITKMTIYNNFANKETLFKMLISYRSSKFISFLECADKGHKNAIVELLAILEFQKKYPFPEMPIFYSSFLRTNPRVFNLYKAKFRRTLKIFIINNINRGIEQGIYLGNTDAENIANFSICTMENMMDKWVVNGAKMNLNMTHEHIIQYHIRGIANPTGFRLLDQYIKEKNDRV